MRRYAISKVPGHEGPCIHTWLCRNRVMNRLDGGVSGFWRRVKLWRGLPLYKTGPEFHGIVRDGKTVESTALRDDS